MMKKSGVVEGMTADGKRFKLDDGEWYSVFNSSQAKGVSTGSFIEFMYTSTNKDGRTYNNIKGSVTVGTAPASRPVTGTSPSAAPASGGYTDSRGFVLKQFPVPALHPDRSIIRQNSLTQANSMLNTVYGMSDLNALETCAEVAEKLIEIARMFEAYSCGELDETIAMAAVKEMLAKESDR